ncbi:hypothetical protein A9Q84_13870 [Halobacteriovorax marinus]|uniref:DUF7790 domain-containing protein n=1 Tax=Halobacteriovorax marinus TaxID=97084 RepID=A0A1Y5F940_9BACT|nr:hypothetical protein A9Q84_13870 [Halobacteriovorax marinus]
MNLAPKVHFILLLLTISCAKFNNLRTPANVDANIIDEQTVDSILKRAGSDTVQYLKTNETYHERFATIFKESDEFGGYIGVGAEQNFHMMASSKAGFAWLIDYNPKVSLLHLIYRAAFFDVTTPEEFTEIFSSEESMNKLISKYYSDSKIINHLNEISKTNQKSLFENLKVLFIEKELRTFLSNSEDFIHVRDMFRNDQVKIISGLNNDPKLFKKIIGEAQEMDIKIKNVYLSNSHQISYIKSNMNGFQESLKLLSEHSDPYFLLSRPPNDSVGGIMPEELFMARTLKNAYKAKFDGVKVGDPYAYGSTSWQYHAIKSEKYYKNFKKYRPKLYIESCTNSILSFIGNAFNR